MDAGTTSTLRADSTLLCTNGGGGPLRYNHWQARISLHAPSGEVLTVSTTGTPFRVKLVPVAYNGDGAPIRGRAHLLVAPPVYMRFDPSVISR